MVKFREEEDLSEEEASQPIPVCDMTTLKLRTLQEQFEKPEPVRRKRVFKPRKKAERQYRLVTQLEAEQIWRRSQAGQSTV